jgi:hypothetical protein
MRRAELLRIPWALGIVGTVVTATTIAYASDAGARRVSATISPYHLAFPLLNILVEERLSRRFSVAQEIGAGGFASARIGQLGARVLYYASGSFDGGMQLGPIVRANLVAYPGLEAIDTPPTMAAEAVELFYRDVQVARSNGRESLFVGLFVGGKGIFGARWGAGSGLTFAMGVQLGWTHLLGGGYYSPSPQATIRGDAPMGLLDLRVGWSL